MKRLSLDGIILISTSLIMLLGGVIKYISPEIFPLTALVGLLFPFALFVFLIGLVLRVSRGYWKGLVWPLIIILSTLSSIKATVGGLASSPELESVVEGESSLKLTSFNVRRMDEFKWLDGAETREALFDWMAEDSSDVLCLQEFPENLKSKLKQELRNYKVVTTGSPSGPVIATSYRVINHKSWHAVGEKHPRGLIADLLVNDDTIRVINVHLQSVGLGRNDYDAVREGTDADDRKRLLGRLSSAYSKRASQADQLQEIISSSPYRVVLAGDFNDTPVSYTTHTVRSSDRYLYDAFSISGSGLGATYVGDLPGLRIDYILHSDGIMSSDFTTHNIKLSDHRPISVKLKF